MYDRNAHKVDLAAQRRDSLSRRRFLRGAGICLALPAFESLLPGRLLAAVTEAGGKPGALATTATGAPLRTGFVYFPNGAIQKSWWPNGNGGDFTLNTTLQPLEPLRKFVRVLGGLDHACAVGGVDGGGDHARANAVFLSGVRAKKSATDIHLGTSIDQRMAQQLGHLTRLPSLELTCDDTRRSSACDSDYACAYQYNISWSSPTTPVSAEANPRLAFERLFGTGAPGERAANSKLRQAAQKSVLDFVMEDAHSMERRLPANDRAKLDQYLTGVREIETRIQRTAHFGTAQDPYLTARKATTAMHIKFLTGLLAALLTVPTPGQAQGTPPGAPPSLPSGAQAVISLWPNGAPGFESRKDIPEQAASYWVKNVNNPSITVFLPAKEKATGAAVIVCPGGGSSLFSYHRLPLTTQVKLKH